MRFSNRPIHALLKSPPAYVHVAQSGDGFLERIDAVVNGLKAPGDREHLLGKATWNDRADELLDVLDHVVASNELAISRKEGTCAVL